MSKEALSSLLQFSAQLAQEEEKHKQNEIQLQVAHRELMEPLFLERHEALKEIPAFWSTVLGSSNTPLTQLMNGTFDNKITRAVTDFQVQTRGEKGKMIQKVIITFKPNFILEAGSAFREVDSDGKTLSLLPIKWKKGSENLKTQSLFFFFDEDNTGKEELILETLKEFDMLFQDPLVFFSEN